MKFLFNSHAFSEDSGPSQCLIINKQFSIHKYCTLKSIFLAMIHTLMKWGQYAVLPGHAASLIRCRIVKLVAVLFFAGTRSTVQLVAMLRRTVKQKLGCPTCCGFSEHRARPLFSQIELGCHDCGTNCDAGVRPYTNNY
jgi:hypothetical protein